MFEVNAKQFLLTYPKSTLSQERTYELLNEISSIKDYVIAKELHADGTPHVHAVIRFFKRFHKKGERIFDLEGFHPNIKTLKTIGDFTRAAEYAKKDGDFISNLVEKKSKRQQLAEAVLEEGLTRQTILNHPELIFTNFNSVRAWLSLVETPPVRVISTRKKRHIWLYGPSNTGKTTWFRSWSNLFSVAEIPQNNDWSHLTPKTDILFQDEYRGSLSVQELNRISDGNTRLNTKGGSVHLGYVIVVILSNFSIRDVYKNVSDEIFLTIQNRFNEYDSSISMPPIPVYII